MTKKFTALRAQLSPERQARAHKRTEEMLKEMPLQELRQARKLSQEAIATVLGAKQASISKLEHRADMYVSTLRSYVEAMGESSILWLTSRMARSGLPNSLTFNVSPHSNYFRHIFPMKVENLRGLFFFLLTQPLFE